ncbi:hypothetical protein [Nocardia pseudobrasiliensis]|uniref:Alanine dehydrogenase/NAD(P) transhydrogenase subunit alpha n=1 Tax=Nocardia pseudobrasiliensis TaxID=45979 RepID=A0A370HWJ6_9NOCA|nr:hypothetical protein [Nocardia pseudobrasiliensis]RDI62883.1 alanine dehydrogenase/NAD(P) transhydrogenase subunit alpha [Nocardia pseudobrasiliensis]
MIVGVLRETAARERRVALVPADVRRLTAADVAVVVQSGAGGYAGFDDAAYRAAGARLVGSGAEVFAPADLVAWVKPPVFPVESMPRRRGLTLVGFQDPIHRAAQIASLRALGVESVAFESVSPGQLPAADALTAMSRIAGSVAYRAGRRLVPAHRRPIRSLLLGCGQAGRSALETAHACGDEPPVVVGNRDEQRAMVTALGPCDFRTNAVGDPALIRDWIRDTKPDLVVCAAARRGSRAPILIDPAGLAALGSGAVVVDLVAKAGGNCVATVVDATVISADGVVVTHRSNYPARRPAAASRSYSAAALAMIGRLANVSVGVSSVGGADDDFMGGSDS